MISFKRVAVITGVFLLMLAMNSFAGPDRDETRSFTDVESIRINTISGNCVLKKGSGSEVEVEVVWNYRPRDSFEPEFRQRGGVLRLNEEMYGSNSGRSTWTITVPEGVDVRFSSASGDLEVEGYTGEINCETASGDIEMINCHGQFDLSTASGDLEFRDCSGLVEASTASGDADLFDCTGEFDISTASGSVDADGITLEEASSFTTASGRVQVVLAATAEYDLTVSTASGRAILDYNGNELKGYYELVSKDRGGRIVAPVDFDGEEKFRRWGDRYVRKWFTKGTDTPQIFVETASGKAVLE